MAAPISRHDTTSKEMSERLAKQGVACGHMRYVMAVSTLLAVIAGVFIFLAFFHGA